MRKSTFENFSYGLAGRVTSQILSFALMIYLARTLGPTEFGSLSLAVAIVGYFNILATLGIQVEGVREIARGQQDPQKTTNLIFSSRILLAVCSYLFLLIYACLVYLNTNPYMFNLLLLYGLSLLSSAFFIDWFFVGSEEMPSLTKATLFGSLFTSVTTLLLVKGIEDVYLIPSLSFIGSVISCTYLLKIYIKRHRLQLGLKLKDFYRLLVASMPFALSSAINQIDGNLDTVLIGYFWGPEEVGYYSVAYRIVIVFSGLVGVYSQSTFSAMIRLNETNKSASLDFLKKNIHVMLYVMIPAVVGGTILSHSLITSFFGEKYTASVMPFMLLLYYILFMALSVTLANFLLSIKKDNVYVKVLVLGSIVNVMTNLAIIPFWKATGAAVAMIATEFFVFMVLAFTVRSVQGVNWLDRRFVLIISLSAGVMGVVCYGLQNILGLHVAVVIILASLVYFALSLRYCLRYFRKGLAV